MAQKSLERLSDIAGATIITALGTVAAGRAILYLAGELKEAFDYFF